MAENLTIQQRHAVEYRGGRLLVSAAAGSGKTKVLVDRLMGYLTDPVSPAKIDEFLIITYTKAAASVARRILSTDPTFNPDYTATGHWNFFSKNVVQKKKDIYMDHKYDNYLPAHLYRQSASRCKQN